jgi:hypothetical protein
VLNPREALTIQGNREYGIRFTEILSNKEIKGDIFGVYGFEPKSIFRQIKESISKFLTKKEDIKDSSSIDPNTINIFKELPTSPIPPTIDISMNNQPISDLNEVLKPITHSDNLNCLFDPVSQMKNMFEDYLIPNSSFDSLTVNPSSSYIPNSSVDCINKMIKDTLNNKILIINSPNDKV